MKIFSFYIHAQEGSHRSTTNGKQARTAPLLYTALYEKLLSAFSLSAHSALSPAHLYSIKNLVLPRAKLGCSVDRNLCFTLLLHHNYRVT